MKNIFLFFISYFFLTNFVYSQDKFFKPDDLFHIDHMDSHNKEFTLYFKGREKSILARGEESNYINEIDPNLVKRYALDKNEIVYYCQKS